MEPLNEHWNWQRKLTVAVVLTLVVWSLMSMAWPGQLVNVRRAEAAPVAPVSSCPTPGLTLDAVVVRVIDGDTIICESRHRYRVRLIDCWAPEIHTKDADEKRRGERSRERLIQLVDERPIRVQIPLRMSLEDSLTFGRVLGHAWTLDHGTPSDRSLSEQMVRAGLATKTKQSF